jgi:hypothetical protein
MLSGKARSENFKMPLSQRAYEAMASVSVSSSSFDECDDDLSSRGPTVEQKAGLKALNAGMVNASTVVKRKSRWDKKSNKRVFDTPDGIVINKFFNPVAGRPYPRAGISAEQQIRCQLTIPVNLIIGSTIATTYAAFNFALSSFSGYANYTALFDQYLLQEVELYLEPQGVNVNDLIAPTLVTCVDLDDSATPTTISTVADHQQAMIGQGLNGRYMRFKPHVAVATYGGAFTSFANIPACWIDSGSPGVQHYGFKVAFTATPVAVTYNLSIRGTFAFRAPGIA